MIERYGVPISTMNPAVVEKGIKTRLENQGLGDLYEPLKVLRQVKKILKEQAEGAKKAEKT